MHHLHYQFLLMICMPVTLAACGGGSSPTASPPSSASSPGAGKVAAPHIVDDEDLTPGLRGIDANGNGIRDDIDRLIAKKYSATPALKKAVEQDARALQKFMEVRRSRKSAWQVMT